MLNLHVSFYQEHTLRKKERLNMEQQLMMSYN